MSTHQIDGLTVTVDADAPRVRDIDLAVRLGYERPRAIRDLIERLIASKNINGSEVRRTVRQTSERGGRPATECIASGYAAEADVIRAWAGEV